MPPPSADDELAAIKRLLAALASQHAPPLAHARPSKRLLHLPNIPLADPPAPAQTLQPSLSAVVEPVVITLKSLKPPLSFSLPCLPSSTIAELKALLCLSDPSAPPADSQRWLYKGKALADNKLLKQYDNIKSGDIVHLMIKIPPPSSAAVPNIQTPSSTIAEPGTPMPASRVTSPTSAKPQINQPKLAMSIPKITMDVDGNEPVSPPFISRSRSGSVASALSPHLGISESFRTVVSGDEFWVELKKFLLQQFGPYGPGEENARQMWEHCFNSSKEWLTASEIARIREAAGISGMAGR